MKYLPVVSSLSSFWLYSPYPVAVWDCRRFGVAVLTRHPAWVCTAWIRLLEFLVRPMCCVSCMQLDQRLVMSIPTRGLSSVITIHHFQDMRAVYYIIHGEVMCRGLKV